MSIKKSPLFLIALVAFSLISCLEEGSGVVVADGGSSDSGISDVYEDNDGTSSVTETNSSSNANESDLSSATENGDNVINSSESVALSSSSITVSSAVELTNAAPVINFVGHYNTFLLGEGQTEFSPGQEIELYTSATDTDVDDELVYWWDSDADGIVDTRGASLCYLSFDVAGEYEIAVRVEDQEGLFDEATFAFSIVEPLPTVELFANGLTSSISVETSEQFTLVASASGNTSVYEWDLDGNGSYETLGYSANRIYSFSTIGYHTIGVRVSNAAGYSASDEIEIYVEQGFNGEVVYIAGAGLGGQVTTGGGWYGNAMQGNGSSNLFACAGNVYDGMMEQPADWGAECETANGQEVTFNIEMGTDAQGYDWGYALIGFDFNENPAGTPDNMKLTYDIAYYGGVCVTYTSPAVTWVLVKTTDDMDGDAYGFRLMPAAFPTEVCKTWAELTKQSWSSPWLFNPANATGMQFKVETAGIHTLVISNVTLGVDK
jgi:hypothetical protein